MRALDLPEKTRNGNKSKNSKEKKQRKKGSRSGDAKSKRRSVNKK